MNVNSITLNKGALHLIYFIFCFSEDIVPVMLDTPPKVASSVIPGRVARRARRQMSMPNPSSGTTVADIESTLKYIKNLYLPKWSC